MTQLRVCPVHKLQQRPEPQRWLIEGLWAEEAVGLLGGEPKSYKSFLALDMALAVASGAPCLRRFAVPRPGRVLLFPAEDPHPVVRERLDAMARAASLALETLDIQVILEPTFRLDQKDDRLRLMHTVEELRPRLLILDPFVRLHHADENSVSEIAPLLGYLRQLQRTFHTAVLVVHHARKGAHRVRPGQALRGTSEFHAFGDCNLYLRRTSQALSLSIEHRAAPSPSDLTIRLETKDETICMCVQEQDDGIEASNPRPTHPSKPSAFDRVLAALGQADCPLSQRDLRAMCRIRSSTLAHALKIMAADARVVKTNQGYQLVRD